LEVASKMAEVNVIIKSDSKKEFFSENLPVLIINLLP
jgi:hypothetical protein